MKKKLKGIIALIMVVAMVMSLFVGISFAADEDTSSEEELGTSLSYATAEDADGNTVITISNSNAYEVYSYTMTLGDGLELVSGSLSGSVSSSDVEVTVSGSGSITLEYTGTYGDTTEYSDTIAVGSGSSDDTSADDTAADEDVSDDAAEEMGDMEMGDMSSDSGALTADELEVSETEDGLYTFEGQIGYFSSGGTTDDDNDYLYVATIIVAGDNVYTNLTNVTADSAVDVEITDSESGHNGIIIIDAGDYTISNATIIMLTDADGTDTCDFSGKGTAIAVYGDSNVTITDSYIETEGVATMPVFCDTGATVTISNSTLISRGGTLYAEYMNSPDQALMVAPPWILGIMGTSRTTNLMGENSTMNVINSNTYSGAWAVLSTDSGSNMYLNIYNTTLTLLNTDESAAAPLQEEGGEISETLDNPYTTTYGSGYGTYVIGAAVETFAGATLNVGTYGSIFTGGSATYTSLTAGETYTLSSATGETDITYTATESKVTVINSDTFGFMIHQDTNTITIENGTEIYSGYATFLVKSGSSNEQVTATIDDAVIENGGVLIQIMDNDDATNGGMMSTDDELNTNGGSMNFAPVHTEDAGFNTDEAENDGTVQSFTFTNGDYSGNIYNASGSDNSQYGPLDGTTLELTIGEGATLTGAIASTAAIHVTYEGSALVKSNGGYAYDTEDEAAEILAYQNTSFTIDEYFSIGQVANLVNYNGANDINVTLTDDAVWYVSGTSVVTTLTIEDSASYVLLEGATLTVLSGDNAGTYEAEASEEGGMGDMGGSSALTVDELEITETEDGLYTFEGQIGSFGSGGTTDDDNDYLYVATIIVAGDDVYTNLTNVTADSAVDVEITDSVSGHNGIIIIDAGEYTISNATITMLTDADGTDTCDFSGKGSAIAVYGDSNVTIEDSYIETSGVATMPVFCDTGATVTIKNTTLISRGGTLYSGYMNSPDQALMVAPPWILGIMGTSRTTNLMGDDSTMNVIDSDTYSGAWAVLSTDSGSNMYLNIYNTTLTLLNADESAAAPLQEEGGEISETLDNPYTTNYGSGYGTYVIGDAVETFAGATLNVGTYGSIFTGGSATYTSLTAGETYTLYSATGETDITYTASEDKVTTINSDTFGFMIHQSANYITIEEGTIINSGYATFLVKSGSSNETVTATIDDAVITNGGVLIQIMDNDDATNGGMMSADDELNTNGGNMNFAPIHTEDAGFNTDEAESDGTVQSFTFTNGDYTGNVYNASGSDNSQYGPLSGTTLELTIGEGATLTGAVASTAAIHVTYEGSALVKSNDGYAYDSEEDAAEILAYQNTSFTIDEYFSIGQVANLVNYNGANDIIVTLTDDAVWYVDGTSVVTELIIEDDAQVVVLSGTLTVLEGDNAGTYTAEAAATDDSTSPTTGDAGTALWVVLAALAVCGATTLIVRRRRFN